MVDGSRVFIDPEMVERYILEIAQDGAVGSTGVDRKVYSPAWVAAQDRVERWMQEAGLETWRDAVGNVWGRLQGTQEGPSIVTGSHIDSQAPGGRFDGVLGVIGGVIALRTLKEQFGTPLRTLEVVSICEEEGSRFPDTNWWGSRAITGTIDADDPHAIKAENGESIAEAMQAVGLPPDRIPEAFRDDIGTFIELHIEQGPILEQEGFPVGIVEGIPGIRHYEIELTGRADHAGGVPIDLRRDPMAAAARMIVEMITTARAWGRPAVTTVGRMHVEPGLTAAVPDKVVFSLDARHPDPEKVRELFETHERTIQRIAAEENVEASYRVLVDHPPCVSDPGIVGMLADAASQEGVSALRMYSGGGHDTQRMGNVAKVAMIFVQSRGGRSHTPEEYTSPEHAAMGIQVLAAAFHQAAYSPTDAEQEALR